MKMSNQKIRIFAGMGLAASLFWGCQNILDQSNGDAAATGTTATDAGTLRLSIKDDSTCKESWSTLLAARTSGHPDSAAETAFLSSCVKEMKATDKGVPVIPADLVPDSNTRCHWIANQIEGGRDSMSVSFNRYCPDDCRKLETGDSAKHERFCHEPGKEPGKGPGHEPGKDTLAEPPHHDGHDTLAEPPHHDGDTLMEPPHRDSANDTCDMLHAKLDTVKPGEAGRADLEHLFKARCKDPLPMPPHHDGDTAVKPPLPPDGRDTLAQPPHHDRDTLVEPPHHDSTGDTCVMLHAKLEVVKPGEAGRADLEHTFAAMCKETLPKPPVVMPPVIHCDEMRKQLASLDPASADYARLKGSVAEHCPEVPAVK